MKQIQLNLEEQAIISILCKDKITHYQVRFEQASDEKIKSHLAEQIKKLNEVISKI